MNDFKHDPFNFDWDSNKINNEVPESQNNHVRPQIWSNMLEEQDEHLSTYSYSMNEDKKKNLNISQKVRELSPNTQKYLLTPGMICDMDPSKLKLSNADLQLKPFYFKAKKNVVDAKQKDNKYWKKREKNNIAARKSRVSRRIKDNQLTLRARFLEEENESLKVKVSHLENKIIVLEDQIKKMEESNHISLQGMDEFVHDIRNLLD